MKRIQLALAAGLLLTALSFTSLDGLWLLVIGIFLWFALPEFARTAEEVRKEELEERDELICKRKNEKSKPYRR